MMWVGDGMVGDGMGKDGMQRKPTEEVVQL